MVEITMVSLIEASNLSYTTTIGTLCMKEAKRIHTFKLLVSKLLGGLGDLDNVQNLEVFFEPFPNNSGKLS